MHVSRASFFLAGDVASTGRGRKWKKESLSLRIRVEVPVSTCMSVGLDLSSGRYSFYRRGRGEDNFFLFPTGKRGKRENTRESHLFWDAPAVWRLWWFVPCGHDLTKKKIIFQLLTYIYSRWCNVIFIYTYINIYIWIYEWCTKNKLYFSIIHMYIHDAEIRFLCIHIRLWSTEYQVLFTTNIKYRAAGLFTTSEAVRAAMNMK